MTDNPALPSPYMAPPRIPEEDYQEWTTVEYAARDGIKGRGMKGPKHSSVTVPKFNHSNMGWWEYAPRSLKGKELLAYEEECWKALQAERERRAHNS
jgi:hypothetical protein